MTEQELLNQAKELLIEDLKRDPPSCCDDCLHDPLKLSDYPGIATVRLLSEAADAIHHAKRAVEIAGQFDDLQDRNVFYFMSDDRDPINDIKRDLCTAEETLLDALSAAHYLVYESID